MIEQSDPGLVRLPISEAVVPKDGYVAYVEQWWCCDEDNLIIWRNIGHDYPQCNRDEVCAERLRKRLYPWAKLARVSVVYLPQQYD